MLKIFILLIKTVSILSFLPIPFSNLGVNKLKVIQPVYNKFNNDAIIFFTGGNSFITPDIYGNFHKELSFKNISIYIPSFKYKDTKIIDILKKKHKSITVIGHSSGASTAINFCNNYSFINKIIFLDPVDILFTDKINISHINEVLIINAGKSYNITYNPFGLPFIPFFKLNTSKLYAKNNIKIYKIDKSEFGHSDILDIKFSNIMHNTRISVGFPIRDKIELYSYHESISTLISNFINS